MRGCRRRVDEIGVSLFLTMLDEEVQDFYQYCLTGSHRLGPKHTVCKIRKDTKKKVLSVSNTKKLSGYGFGIPRLNASVNLTVMGPKVYRNPYMGLTNIRKHMFH
jgi:hypothetical protein